PEDRVLVVPRPRQPVGTGGTTDGVRLVLLSPGVPHPVQLCLVVVQDVGAHHGDLLPRPFGRENWLVALPFPRLAVGAGGVTDPGFALGLAGVPHVVSVALFEDHRAVDVILPTGVGVRPQRDDRFAPGQPVFTLGQGDALPGSPGEPHAV